MDTMKIDFSGVEGQKTFEPIPAGKYIVNVEDFREGVASERATNPGAQTISWQLAVETTLNGDTTVTHRGEDINVENRILWENMTLVQNSFWRLKAFLEACGFDVSGEIDFRPEEVVGSRLVVKVGIQGARKNKETGEEYDARNTIKSFHPVED